MKFKNRISGFFFRQYLKLLMSINTDKYIFIRSLLEMHFDNMFS